MKLFKNTFHTVAFTFYPRGPTKRKGEERLWLIIAGAHVIDKNQ